jgi:hypothetical protein
MHAVPLQGTNVQAQFARRSVTKEKKFENVDARPMIWDHFDDVPHTR